MKTIYALTTRIMNGTVTLSVITDCFASSDLAERAEVEIKNKNQGMSIITDIVETTLYESEDEVPILNKECST